MTAMQQCVEIDHAWDEARFYKTCRRCGAVEPIAHRPRRPWLVLRGLAPLCETDREGRAPARPDVETRRRIAYLDALERVPPEVAR